MKEKVKPEHKDPHRVHRYPLSIKHEIFRQYFLLAAKIDDRCLDVDRMSWFQHEENVQKSAMLQGK